MHRSILKQFAEYLHILQHFSIQPATLPTYTVLLEGRPVNHKPAGYLPGQGHGIGTPLAAIPPSVPCEGKLPHLWTTIRQTGYLVREGLLFGHNPPIFSVPEGPPTDRNHLRSVKGSAAVDFSDMHPPGSHNRQIRTDHRMQKRRRHSGNHNRAAFLQTARNEQTRI